MGQDFHLYLKCSGQVIQGFKQCYNIRITIFKIFILPLCIVGTAAE